MSTLKIKNLSSEKIDKQILIRAGESKYTVLPFYKSRLDLSNDNQKNRFIKCVESIIRKSAVYRAYIFYLKEKIGLKKCMMFGHLDDTMCNIEMHHGPIFTLYDYVEITINFFLKNNFEISTFAIANQILQDHCDNLIQIVMLSEMAHQAIHQPNEATSEFLDIQSAWGDLFGYLLKYEKCLDIRHFNKINRYFDRYTKKHHSNIFITKIKQWKDHLQSKLKE